MSDPFPFPSDLVESNDAQGFSNYALKSTPLGRPCQIPPLERKSHLLAGWVFLDDSSSDESSKFDKELGGTTR
jgi:hypothetical protein